MSLTGKLTHSENLHCVGRLEIGQAGYLLNRPRMSIYLKLQREERRAFSGCFSPKGGGGYSNFFRIRRIGPSIYPSPQKKIRNIKHPKKYLKF